MCYQNPPAQVETQKTKGEKDPKRKADVHQESHGAGSPNIVMGDHGTVNISQEPQLQGPTFQEKIGGVVKVIAGAGSISISVHALQGGKKWAPFVFGDKRPFLMYVEDGALYVDVHIPDELGTGGVDVVKNHFTAQSAGWDKNSSARAFEVTRSGAVVFQMVRNALDVITIKGVFNGPTGVFILDDNGMKTGSNFKPSDARITPIFKYPAWKYPGKYADGSN